MLIINGVRLQYNTGLELSGITLDRHLTWNVHGEDLISRCKSSLNAIKCVSHIHWRADREDLLRLYNEIMVSEMDYGYAVYWSVRGCALEKPNHVENLHVGFCYATGAVRTGTA